jgi:hypothetical protein
VEVVIIIVILYQGMIVREETLFIQMPVLRNVEMVLE